MASASQDDLELPSERLPREPSAYRASLRFLYHFSRREDPPITEDVVETCIREGTVSPGRDVDEDPRYEFDAWVGNVKWRLVVGLNQSEPHTVITAFAPAIHDPDEEERPPL